jgi:hypothetical protein
VAEFFQKIRQDILKKALAKQKANTKKEKPENDLIIPVIMLSICSLLIIILIIIIRKRRQKRF